MRDFTPHAFGGYPLDKSGVRRKDAGWLRAAQGAGDARVALFWRMQPYLLEESGASPVAAAAWLGPAALDLCDPAQPVLFLGVDPAGAPHFAASLPARADPDALPIAGLGRFEDVRAAAMRLSGGEAALLGCAKALFEWHGRNGFCGVCGAATDAADGGWRRLCAGCGAEHFPRVDPVAIMLPTLGDRCCLGRQARFPPGMVSAFAGFIEPGETLEEACARELLEEVGLVARAVRHHSSQPWPFPSQLMLGMLAEVEGDALTLDQEEIVEAVWLTRAQARAALAGGVEIGGRRWHAPPPLAIAHHLVKAWAEEAS